MKIFSVGFCNIPSYSYYLPYFVGSSSHKLAECKTLAPEIHPIKNKQSKLSQYKYCYALKNKIELPKVTSNHVKMDFLDDLQSYKIHFDVLKAVDSLNLFQTADINSLIEFQSLKKSVNNALNAKFGDLINRFWSQSVQTKDAFINELAKKANHHLLEEYRSILNECGCSVCLKGATAEPVDGKLSSDNICHLVNHKIDSLKSKYVNFSFRSLKRFSDISLNLNQAILSTSAYSSLYSFRVCDMKAADFLEIMSTKLVRTSFDSLAVESLPNISFDNAQFPSLFDNWEEILISDKSLLKWVDGDGFYYCGDQHRIYGIDSPEIGSVVVVKRYLKRNINNLKTCGSYEICSYPGLNAWQHAEYLMQTCTSIKVIRKKEPNSQSRFICTVKFMLESGEIDYACSTLSEGLSFLYPSFSLMKEYAQASAQARFSKSGCFVLPKDAILKLLPWNYRGVHGSHSSCAANLQRIAGDQTSYSVFCLPYECNNVNRNLEKFPICCSNHSKDQYLNLKIKKSSLHGAGLGVFNNGPPINEGDYICAYSEFHTGVLLPKKDRDYLFANSTLSFDGAYVVEVHPGPLINDRSINVLLNELKTIVERSDANAINDANYLLEGEGCKKVEVDSANAVFVVDKTHKIVYIKASRAICTGHEIFLSYGIKMYWYSLLKNYFQQREEEQNTNPLSNLFKTFDTAIQLHPEIKSFLKPIK